MIKIILLPIVFVLVYYLYKYAFTNKIINLINKNKIYIKKLEKGKILRKIKKQVTYYIDNVGNKKIILYMSVISIILACVVFATIQITINFLSLAVIISLLILFLPYQYIQYKNKEYKEKFIQEIPLLLISLKNSLKAEKDILKAFNKVNSNLISYKSISKFNSSIRKGADISVCFEFLKTSIDIAEFSNIITIFQQCYIYGGDFIKIISNYQKEIAEFNEIKERMKEKNNENKLTIIIMLIINIYVVLSFILNNAEYKKMFFTTTIGKIIILTNLLISIYSIYMVKNINTLKKEGK
ncbi:MAG: hypothetical protein RSB51_00350 [Clostridia bacterium]